MRSKEQLKYLAMRAKKMVGRLTDKELPSAEKLRENFQKKGEELTPAEAELLLTEVKIHRGLLSVPSHFSEKSGEEVNVKTGDKPATKAEVDAIRDDVEKLKGRSEPAQKYTRSHGR